MSAPDLTPSNPARLWASSGLFALPVVVAQLRYALGEQGAEGAPDASQASEALELRAPSLLTAREWDSIRQCAPRRIRDFCAGRLCAQRALAEYAVVGFELLAGSERQPLWPAGLIGSITHTEGYSAAVVGARQHVLGVGIDAEHISAVHADLWPAICAPHELERLQRLPAHAQALAAALTFAAKEAFFKCEYPLAAERFGFEEVQLEEAQWQATAGRFQIAWQRASRLDAFLEHGARRRLLGRFQREGDLLVVGVTLAPL